MSIRLSDILSNAYQGIQGVQGTQGIQGIQGLQGPQGVQGTQGIIGESYWTSTSAGINALSNAVGIGTTNPRFALEVGSVGASGTSLYVNGDARITGILTVGTSSITLDGTDNQINVGSGVTIHHIDGVQVGENTVHSSGLTINNLNVSNVSTLGITTTTNLTAQQLNVSGVVTASSFSGNASSATYATNAGIATYATSAGIATYATNAGIATALQNARTFEITGDIIASPISFNGTGNVSLAATIQPNSVGLGTDTTGDYIQSISGTSNQITVTGGTGEGSTPTLSVPNQFTAPQDVTVTRDLQVNRNLNVNGNITIGGTSATLFANEFKVYDPDLVLGFRTDVNGNDISTDNTANHGGIAVASTEGTPLIQLFDVGIGETNPATYKKFMWFKSGTFSGLGTDAWISNYAIGIGSTQVPNGVRLAAGGMQVTDRTISSPQLNITGVSTFTNGPVLIGSATETGTASQRLQVTGGGYFSGSVGIGSTTPASKLTVVENPLNTAIETIGNINSSSRPNWNFAGLYLRRTASNTAIAKQISFLLDGDSVNDTTLTNYLNIWGTYSGTPTTNSTSTGLSAVMNLGAPSGIALHTNGSERSRIDSSGNFLVGTSSSTGTASQPLQVTGGAYVSGKLGIGATNPTPTLQVSGNYLSAATPTLGIATGNLYITNADPTYGLLIGNSSALGHSWLQVQRTDGTATAYNLSLEPSGGNVLVGTVSQTGTASQPLQVTGGGYFSGSVGVGTTNPSSKLEVYGGNTTSVTLKADTEPGIDLNTTDGNKNVRIFNSYGNFGISGYSGGENYILYHNNGSGVPANQYTYFQVGGSERLRIDGSGRLLVGTSSATGPAVVQAQTPTTLSTTADSGIRFANTATKTYPTTANFNVTTGLDQNIELGNAVVVDPTTPGGFNFVYGIRNQLTKSAGNVQDIERLYFNGLNQVFNWTDANTCKQYTGIQDTFNYGGINASGRTSSSLTAQSLTLNCPNGGTQTVSNTNGTNGITYYGLGTATINISNSSNIAPTLNIRSFDAGTKTINITNHTFLGTSTFWGSTAAAGTLSATITNLYGLRLTAPSSSTGLTITNNWGISQEWSSAKNWFAGASNQFPNITTTASGANAFLDSADSNRLYRSTSSIVYKKDVEDLDHALADNVHQFRPVWYRSKCEIDCQDWSWFGLIAEEVAAIEPRLVHYGYQEDAYELVDITDTVELQPDDPRRESGQETEEVTKQERRLKSNAQKVPNGVAYDRLTVLLLDVVQRQEDRIKNLEARLIALESQ